jgi:5-methylcytosine-specific restriction enzyme B
MHDKQGYREYLSRDGKAENTIDSYCSGINYISRHCGGDVFQIADLSRLESMYRDYSQGGQFSEIGEYGNAAARNALRHWIQYVKGSGVVVKTWLLTWNPENHKDGGDAGVRQGEVSRWTCHSRQPQSGDHVFLIRLGEEPRGLVAYGKVTRPSYESEDWRNSSKMRNYIDFLPEETRSNCASGLLPMILLQKLSAPASFKWSAQSSGIEIPPAIADKVHEWWAHGRGKHSLAQYIAWSAQDPKESRPTWLSHYQSRLDHVADIRDGNGELDDAALDWLWLTGRNGVCSVAPAFLSNADYQNNRTFLGELAKKILADPGESTYAEVIRLWDEAKEQGRFRQRYTAVINRVFAAAAPERYTTVVKASNCQWLVDRLNEEFELPGLKSNSWPELNASIKRSVKVANAHAGTEAETNVALWQLLKAYIERDKSLPAEVEIPDDVPFKEEDQMVAKSSKNEAPLNLILYGPPGTGKTYSTIDQAVQILEPELLESGADRGALKAAFDRYVAAGQIVFTTFHQSFSYEDFVEGLRALTDDEGALSYAVEDGVFKRLCIQARSGRAVSDDPFEKALTVLLEKTEQGEDWLLQMKTKRGKSFLARYAGDKTFLVYPASNPDLKHGYTANMEHVRALYQFGTKSAYNYSYVQGMLDFLKQECGLPDTYVAPSSTERKRFVLIIDEINRGNVARIFGELITLIEDSKREGHEEALSVLLPYSKQAFSVPDNVFIIGTMNTADRSLTGLDIALRRRFSFREMPPRPELLDAVEVDGVNVGLLLRVINQRIEVLLDREHCLGHAYFMPLLKDQRLETLSDIFRRNVLPLLQEYFFEDWQRIQWVLNDHRKQDDFCFVCKPQTNQEALFGPEVSLATDGQCWRINDEAFGRVGSYAGILSAEAEAQ